MNQHKQRVENYNVLCHSPMKKIEFQILPSTKSIVAKGKLLPKEAGAGQECQK